MPAGIDLGVSGLASGFDWRSLVDQLVNVERAPQRILLADQQAIQARKAAFSSIATQLSALQTRAKALNDTTLFDSRKTAASDADLASATADDGAALGTYAFHITQLATAAVRKGTANIAASLNATADVSALVLGNAPFGTAVTAGTFMVNGKQ